MTSDFNRSLRIAKQTSVAGSLPSASTLLRPVVEKFIMAEVIFSAVVGDLAGRVISHLVGQFNGEDKRTEAKLQRICHMLIKVRSAIEEARGRQITNYGTLEWLSELYDGLYQGRYLLDTVGCRDLQEETEEVKHPDKNCQPIHRPLVTNIFVEGQMFGRHVEKERIINFLLHDDGRGKLAVLPIIGEMGVGKTTLAQHVCDDERVREHFPVIMYSSFSYTLAMARGEPKFILESRHAVGDAQNFIDSVHVLNEKYLSKRFLIVFEDVDMRKKQMLEDLLPILQRHGKQGSKIIIITGNRSVTSMGTVQPMKLKVLPHPEYWFFFKAHAFAGRDVEEDPRMVAAGKAIARKLNGSFFGAKIVGAVLKARPDPRFWCKVLRSNIGGMSLLGDGMGQIADLAENLLPSHVYMCKVTVSKNPYVSQTELARLDVSPGADCLAGDGIRFAKVLLCRSIFPFQCLHYTAHCDVRRADDLSKIIRIGGSGGLAHIRPSRKGLPVYVCEDRTQITACSHRI
ncbi:unnamed protein product [Alopecurus aequalis]